MKNYILLILLTSILTWSTSCNEQRIKPSGRIMTVEKHFSHYSEIEVSSQFNVKIDFSDTEERILLRTDDNLMDLVSVKKVANRLVIGLTRNASIKGNATLEVTVVTHSVSDFTASGASEITVNDIITAPEVLLNLSGASKFTGEVEATSVITDLSGASKATIQGSASNADFKGTGASNIDGQDLFIKELSVNLSGASNACANVSNELDVTASGASQISYFGNAVIKRQSLSGSATIKHK